jgi:hypothetical protein
MCLARHVPSSRSLLSPSDPEHVGGAAWTPRFSPSWAFGGSRQSALTISRLGAALQGCGMAVDRNASIGIKAMTSFDENDRIMEHDWALRQQQAARRLLITS